MSAWKRTILSNIIELLGGGTPKTTCNEYWNGNIPWLSVVDFNNGLKYVSQTEKNITQKGLENSSAKLLSAGDIIISARGTIGALAILKKTMSFNQSCYGVRGKKDIAITDWVYYQLKNIVDEFSQKSHGGVFDTITRSTFNEIEIELPSVLEQKAIASILSSIDDKIDLLHRQNKILESMAETLFRLWFIEDNQVLWEEKSLSEIAVFTNGLACQKYPASVDEKGLPVLKIKELQSGFSNTTDIATSKVNSKYIVHHGDIIFAWSASLMVKIWSGPDCVLNQHLFNVKSDKYPKWFYYEWCKYHLKEFINISQSHATTMGHIIRKDLDEAIVKVPPDKELSLMSKEMIPILNQRIEKMKQILTLENLRDTLLPKLMSGEVRVKLD